MSEYSELIKILTKEDYINFLVVHKKVPLWFTNEEDVPFYSIGSVEGVDFEDGLDMQKELSLGLLLVPNSGYLDLERTVKLLDMFNRCIQVLDDNPWCHTFGIKYRFINSYGIERDREYVDSPIDRNMVLRELFLGFDSNICPVEVIPLVSEVCPR